MSVTITILNNVSYINENHPEMIETETYDDDYEGQVSFKVYPFEMNLANGNFFALWSSLGLEADYCGEIDPESVLKALSRFDVNTLVSEDIVDGRMISCGRSIEQVSRYFWNLSLIAREANHRKELIVWG